MSNLPVYLLIIAGISLYGACNNHNNKSHDYDLIDTSKVTKIIVKILDVKISGDRLLKTITSPSEINQLVDFTNEHVLARSSLMSDIDKIFSIQDRSTQVNMAFYQSDNYLGSLGLGRYNNDKYFIKYRQIGESKVAIISKEQKKRLLDMIGYAEDEFDRN